jgi:hypothetical protein
MFSSATHSPCHFRIRHDTVDQFGKLTLRRPQLLAQPTKKPGQRPGFSVTDDPTHL